MTTLLYRFTVKPKHLEQYLELWPEVVALRQRHGFEMHRAFVETDAEPKVTMLYSHEEAFGAGQRMKADPTYSQLHSRLAPHVFRNRTLRPVRVEAMTRPGDLKRTAIMRRYDITGPWSEFLELWRQIVVIRERHGFDCLFAVADEPKDMFTWAFGFDGTWKEFPDSQRGYYQDPERIALRDVFDYMADYSIHPARQLAIPVE